MINLTEDDNIEHLRCLILQDETHSLFIRLPHPHSIIFYGSPSLEAAALPHLCRLLFLILFE